MEGALGSSASMPSGEQVSESSAQRSSEPPVPPAPEPLEVVPLELLVEAPPLPPTVVVWVDGDGSTPSALRAPQASGIAAATSRSAGARWPSGEGR